MNKLFLFATILALSGCASSQKSQQTEAETLALSEKIKSVSSPADQDPRKESPLTATEALDILKTGNQRYLEGILKKN